MEPPDNRQVTVSCSSVHGFLRTALAAILVKPLNDDKVAILRSTVHELRNDGCCNIRSLESAAEDRNLEMLRFFHENSHDAWTSSIMDFAARSGHLESVEFLHKSRSEGCTTAAMDDAATNGRVEVVEWLHEHRQEGCTFHAMDRAAAKGHLHVVQFLHEHRSEGCSTRAILLVCAH